ncbi:MAG: hypothetical protein ACYCY0_01075 [Acidithiobacillus ferrivorans]
MPSGVAGQEALAGEVTIGVEVGVLGVARLEQDRILPGGIPIAALGIQSLAMGGGVAFDEMIGHVHLGAGGVKELPPALQRSREALGAIAMTFCT